MIKLNTTTKTTPLFLGPFSWILTLPHPSFSDVMLHDPGWGCQKLTQLASLESNKSRTTFTAGVNTLPLLLRGQCIITGCLTTYRVTHYFLLVTWIRSFLSNAVLQWHVCLQIKWVVSSLIWLFYWIQKIQTSCSRKQETCHVALKMNSEK